MSLQIYLDGKNNLLIRPNKIPARSLAHLFIWKPFI